jgi:hypothetical protein
VAYNKRLPIDLALEMNFDLARCALAARQDVPAELVDRLAGDPAAIVRKCVATYHPRWRDPLARDPDADVRAEAAHGCSRERVAELVKDPSSKVRWAVARWRCAELTREEKDALRNDPEEQVRRSARMWCA